MQTIRENFGKKGSSYIEYVKFSGQDLIDVIKVDINGAGFIISDILRILNPSYGKDFDVSTVTVPSSLYMIHAIHTDECDKEDELDKEHLSEFLIGKEEELIIVRACLLKVDFPDEPTDEQYDADLMRQAMFLEPFGFRNINSICNMEYSVPFVMLNRNPIAEIIHAEALRREYHKDKLVTRDVIQEQLSMIDPTDLPERIVKFMEKYSSDIKLSLYKLLKSQINNSYGNGCNAE